MFYTPLARSYWVQPGKLLAGAYPGSRNAAETIHNLTRLLDAGIRVIVNLMEADEVDHDGNLFRPYDEEFVRLGKSVGVDITVKRIPVRDLSVPTPATMNKILDRIDAAIDSSKPVYVHCWGGRGRTGTVVGCYLVRHGMEGDKALAKIRDLRANEPTAHKPSPETREQIEMVRSWTRLDQVQPRTRNNIGNPMPRVTE